MARMIDGERTAKTFAEHPYSKFYGFQVAEEIAEAPAVDAVEVVRCKDCEYYFFGDAAYDACCTHSGGLSWPELGDFCSNGKRRAKK